MKTSKIISIILAVVMLLGCMPVAFAEEAEPAETQASGLKAEVLFDKAQYGLLDTAVMTVKLTNESDKVLNIKQVYVLTLDFSPKGFIDYNNLDFKKIELELENAEYEDVDGDYDDFEDEKEDKKNKDTDTDLVA